MRWYYPGKGELPDKNRNNDDDIECLCELSMDEQSYLYRFLSERFMTLYYKKAEEKFFDGECYIYDPNDIKRWCYLDEAISKLDE